MSDTLVERLRAEANRVDEYRHVSRTTTPLLREAAERIEWQAEEIAEFKNVLSRPSD